jgi:hypothetical protein
MQGPHVDRKVLKLSNKSQLFDLNERNFINFKADFELRCNEGKTFYMAVANQTMVDTDEEFGWQTSHSSGNQKGTVCGGSVSYAKDMFLPHYLVIRADETCTVECAIQIEELPSTVPQEASQSQVPSLSHPQHSGGGQHPLLSRHTIEASKEIPWFKIFIGVIILAIVGYFAYTYWYKERQTNENISGSTGREREKSAFPGNRPPFNQGRRFPPFSSSKGNSPSPSPFNRRNPPWWENRKVGGKSPSQSSVSKSPSSMSKSVSGPPSKPHPSFSSTTKKAPIKTSVKPPSESKASLLERLKKIPSV